MRPGYFPISAQLLHSPHYGRRIDDKASMERKSYKINY